MKESLAGLFLATELAIWMLFILWMMRPTNVAVIIDSVGHAAHFITRFGIIVVR